MSVPQCSCCSPLCSVTEMLPKVETRVVLVGEAGENGELRKALQVYTFALNPEVPPLPTLRHDNLLARTNAIQMEICLGSETLENIWIPLDRATEMSLISWECQALTQRTLVRLNCQCGLWANMWLLPVFALFCGAARKTFPKPGSAVVLLLIQIEMGTSLNSLSELSSLAPPWF